ncbi:hypothetical protein cypCar_00001679 [Cyprinus carpio]|nr:hypothetical protein cypCar_00001679 [Cyprinus carpio]
MVGEMETKEKPKPTPDYLMQLMNDKKLMSSLPNFCGIFNHLERLLDEEIGRVRKDMYNDTLNGSTDKRTSELPDAVGPIAQLQEKLYVPVKEYPDFNFVGRILGPRGLTAKQLEAETGCKIMEEQNRGKPNWEHLNEDLHVLITVEDSQNRAEIKLKRAVEEVKKLLVPAQPSSLLLLGRLKANASPHHFTGHSNRVIATICGHCYPPAPAAPTPHAPHPQIQTSAIMPTGHAPPCSRTPGP